MRKPVLILFSLLVLLFLILTTWLSLQFFFLPMNTSKNSVIVFIPQGASVAQVTTELETKGVSRPAYYFLLWIKSWSRSNKIKAGEYQILSGFTLKQFWEKLEKGQVLLHKITFPEGWTFQQFLTKLAADSKLSHTLKNQTNDAVMATIGHPGTHPEGLFYPDTYLFTLGTKDTQILRLSYDLMQKKLQQAWSTRAANLPYRNSYEALIVASLIEKETALASERPMIAGVILHRLKIGMRLQIDAAVLYGVNEKNRRTLTRTDLSTDTPYNTYTRSGLPPTPIAMPGGASIYAALHPAPTPALYYVAKGDGGHIFSQTLQAHAMAVQAYRQQRSVMLAKDATELYFDMSILPQCLSAALLGRYWQSLGE